MQRLGMKVKPQTEKREPEPEPEPEPEGGREPVHPTRPDPDKTEVGFDSLF